MSLSTTTTFHRTEILDPLLYAAIDADTLKRGANLGASECFELDDRHLLWLCEQAAFYVENAFDDRPYTVQRQMVAENVSAALMCMWYGVPSLTRYQGSFS